MTRLKSLHPSQRIQTYSIYSFFKPFDAVDIYCGITKPDLDEYINSFYNLMISYRTGRSRKEELNDYPTVFCGRFGT